MAKFKYDAKAKAGYVYLNGSAERKDVMKTIEVVHDGVFVDFGKEGKPVGIEILHLGCLGNKDFEVIGG